MAPAAPAFLFGIGAAKAGTTWIAKALRQHAEVAMPPFKEVHYFDSLEKKTSLWAMDQLIDVRQRTRTKAAAMPQGAGRDKLLARVADMDRWLALVGSGLRNDKRYEALMRRAAGAGTRVVADVTPAYAMLSQERLSQMHAMNGAATRFLMILRDPVDRLWSNLSMTATRRASRGRTFPVVLNELMTELKQGNSRELDRSDYAATLSRLEAAVPVEKRMVVFFEDLFQPATLERLQAFLGLGAPLVGPEKPANAGAGHAMDADTHQVLAAALQPQYESVMSRIGAVPARWQDNMRGPVQ